MTPLAFSQEIKRGIVPVSILFFMMMAFRVAWVTEDAFISFRALDQFFKGNGLVYNAGERVQVYTDPLYCLFLGLFTFFTNEYFYTSIGFSLLLSMLTVLILGFKATKNPWIGGFSVLFLSMSVAFTEFSTSGLENPMSHFLLALFYYQFLSNEKPSLRQLSLIAGLAATNRLDSILFFLPAILFLFLEKPKAKTLADLFIGFSPLIAWEFFSLFYYGFPFPNTAYAKLNLGLETWKMAEQGVIFIIGSFTHDPVTGFLIGLTLVSTFLAWKTPGQQPVLWLLAGIFIKIGYVVLVGGDYMLGRFLTDIMLASVLVFAYLADNLNWSGWAHGLIFTLCFGLALTVRHSPFASDMSYGVYERNQFEWMTEGLVDERSFYYKETGLANRGRFEKVRNGSVNEAIKRTLAHEWGDDKVIPMGNAGLFGFYSDTSLHLMDIMALCDPLIARLPLASDYHWRTGHYSRNVPEGYQQTLVSGKNQIRDSSLAQYYKHLKMIVSGPLFSTERLSTIVKMNLGLYQPLMNQYLENNQEVTYHHLKTKNGKYHYPMRRLTHSIPYGTSPDDVRIAKFGGHFGSLFLDLDSLSQQKSWTASFSYESEIAIRFYQNGKRLGTSKLIPLGPDKSGMQPFAVLVPKSAWKIGYDAIEVVPYTNDLRTATAFWQPVNNEIALPNHLFFHSHDAVREGQTFLVQPNGSHAIYGPYIPIPDNHYEICMDFERTGSSRFQLNGNVHWDAGNLTFADNQQENPKDDRFTFDFQVSRPVPSMEFRYQYQSNEPIPLKVNRISLKVLP